MSKPIYLFSITSHPGTIHINSLDTNFFTPAINFSQYDSLIISSKQIVNALKEYGEEYCNIPALCVSKQTAKSFEEAGGKILEIGNGYGANLSEIIKTYSKDTKWLYLRAKEIASDFVEKTIEQGYNIDEVILYETFCSKALKEVEIEDEAVLIFTSPSSVKCFLKSHFIKPTHNIVVIGKTTAKALPKNISCVISAETSLDSCFEIAKRL